MSIPAASSTAAATTSSDATAAMSAMDAMTNTGIEVTLQTAYDQLKMAIAAAVANIMKTVGSNMEDASRKN